MYGDGGDEMLHMHKKVQPLSFLQVFGYKVEHIGNCDLMMVHRTLHRLAAGCMNVWTKMLWHFIQC